MVATNVCPNPFSGGVPMASVCPTTVTTVALFLNTMTNLINVHPKIGDPCGRVTSDTTPRNEYDFIVVGSGAGGSAVAARLSEIPEWKVLLLEAGPDEPAAAQIPSNFGIYVGSEIDWKYKTSNEKYACLATNGICSWPRGKNLGGTTVHHGMAYHRGNPKDYQHWVDLGNKGWSYKELLPFFKKSEDNTEIKRVGREVHGVGGPMTVQRFPYQPPFTKAILAAAKETGYGTTEDMVGKKILGFNIAQTMSKNGVRQSAAAAFLRPARNRPNLDIILNATATKLITEGNRVTGVEYDVGGQRRTVKVKREVIVSGGIVGSPQLLLLSGIGPKEDLEALGIPVVKDLPGVGKNVHNHVSYGIDFVLPENYTRAFIPSDVQKYLTKLRGPLASTGLAQVTALLASNYTTPDYPDIQIFFSGWQECCKPNGFGDLGDYYPHRSVRFTAVNVHPRSRGTITLASKDPLEHPIIWTNDLSDPQDVEVLVAGLHVVLNMANSKVMKAKGLKVASQPEVECSQHEFLSDDYLRCSVHINTRTENHQTGSCKMGPASDPLAVVDRKLRVYGVKGLRIADASVQPQVVSGNPHASVTVIGERVAHFIKKAHPKVSNEV